MKTMFLLLVLSFLFFTNYSVSQSLLLEENFDYVDGTFLSNDGWTAYSGEGANQISISPGSLSYLNYSSSGIGNSANLVGTSSSSEDDKKTFALQTVGSVYISFLVNFSSATTSASGDYFLGFFTSTGETAKGRVFVKRSDSEIAFGISKGSTTPNLSQFIYSLNTTYLLVLKYTFNSSSSDDVISLFINPDLNNGEPQPDLVNIDVATDLSNVGAIFLRQGGSAYNLIIDGIRVSDSWSLAPLPVQLTFFTAKSMNNRVLLTWTTATEVNNYGFEIQKSVEASRDLPVRWETIGFVEGHGNSNSPKEYSFIDTDISLAERSPQMGANGRSYRLKQIDFDGGFEYSDIVTVNQLTDGLEKTELFQNHPNPFNPSTQISFELSEAGKVNISIYNMLGQKVAELINQKMSSGNHSINFNANNLSSGFYFYKLETSNYSKSMKMLLLR